MEQWIPEAVGAGFEFTPILKPLEPFKDQLVVVSNLTRSHPGSQVGDHAVSAAGFLTGVWPKRTEAEDVLANTTIDQVVAQQIGQDTPFPSLELATEDFTGYVGACSPGFSCAYLNTISWSSPTTPLPMEINPRVVFERMFGQARHPAQRAARDARRAQHPRLDRRRKRGTLQRGLGTRDRARVDEYLDNMREIERRIQRAEAHNSAEVTLDAPVGVPESFEEHVGADVRPAGGGLPGRPDARLHVHAVARAEPADLSATSASPSSTTRCRITATTRRRSRRTSRSTPTTWRCSPSSSRSCASTPDGDGSLLDHSLIFYGGGMGNPNGHASDPLPVVAVGGGVGKGHRHIKLQPRTPVGNLWLAVANKFGSQIETFGDSNGRVEDLLR